MSDKVVPFPNKINNPPLLFGFERDLAIAIPLITVSPVLLCLLLGATFYALPAGLLGYFIGKPAYMMFRKKMKRGYIAHWCWIRGRIYFVADPEDGFKSGQYISGYDVHFRD